MSSSKLYLFLKDQPTVNSDPSRRHLSPFTKNDLFQFLTLYTALGIVIPEEEKSL